MKWDINAEERHALRLLQEQPGWKLYRDKLRELEEDCWEGLEASETPDEWRKSQGLLRGVQNVTGLIKNLISVAEEGGQEKWIQKQIRDAEKEQEELEALLLEDSRRARRDRIREGVEMLE